MVTTAELPSKPPSLFSATKIVCLARTFAEHARELGNEVPKQPIYFLKAPTAFIGPGEAIIIPPSSEEVHHEAEVAVWIGSELKRASVAQAEEAISGWTVLNDVTARDLQRADGGRFARAKNFDTFCPISPNVLQTLDWPKARIQCWVDGRCQQDGSLSNLSHTPAELVSFLSHRMTLRAGDLISLGTPAGVGPIMHGQTVEVRLVAENRQVLISLTNPVMGQALT